MTSPAPCPHLEPEPGRLHQHHILDPADLQSLSIEDNAVPTQTLKLQRWIDLVRELFLKPQLPSNSVDSALREYLPEDYHHAIRPVPALDPSEPRTFPRFRDLPTELRLAIWEFAAARPRKVIRLGGALTNMFPPVNGAEGMPRVALTCKEAWDVVRAGGTYCRPEGPTGSRTWVTAQHLVFIPSYLTLSLNFLSRAGNLDLICSRREIAVDYHHLVAFNEQSWNYRFLRRVKKLDTLVCIMRTPEIIVAGAGERSPARNRRIPQRVIMYDDQEDWEKAASLLRDIDTKWHHIRRGENAVVPLEVRLLPPPVKLKCLDCERRQWESGCLPRVKAAWVRMMLSAEEPETREDAGIFPEGSDLPNEAHPWVRQTLAEMPKVKPAILVTLVKPRFAEQGLRPRRSLGRLFGRR
jgi:hypothetical protein